MTNKTIHTCNGIVTNINLTNGIFNGGYTFILSCGTYICEYGQYVNCRCRFVCLAPLIHAEKPSVGLPPCKEYLLFVNKANKANALLTVICRYIHLIIIFQKS